ncbi:MAG: OsmC family protein [Candidatus Zixiibacteriota bacterium]
MGLNNINLEPMDQFYQEVKADPDRARKSKKVEGEWVFEEGKPQFRTLMPHQSEETNVESDFAPFMGGRGLAPDPIQYCLYGLAACFAGTFVSLATQEGIQIKLLKVSVENKVDLTRTLGLSDNPIVEEVVIKTTVESDAPRTKIEEIEALARDRCPGVYCLTNPVPVKTELSIQV